MLLQRFVLFYRLHELEICNYPNPHNQKCALTRSSKLLLPSIPKSENPMSKGKIEKDSIEQCWLTEDVDYDWGPCYLEVYKYQTYDPNVSYPQGSFILCLFPF